MEKLIEQAKKEDNWKLVEHLHFLDHVASYLIELDEKGKDR